MLSQLFVLPTTARFEGIESDFILKYEKYIWINSGLNLCTRFMPFRYLEQFRG